MSEAGTVIDRPVVSVVIPTRNRADLVRRAVRSALAQTMSDLEVIVVIDGSDPATVAALGVITDPRLRVVTRERSGGASAARNTGIDLSRGAWIGFLDDDDEWMPTKLEAQLREAARSAEPAQLISCRKIARSPTRDSIWPRRFPDAGEHLSEYLLRRRSAAQGDGGIHTSSILVSRCVVERERFDTSLVVHEDWEWLLRAKASTGMRVAFVEEPLAIWHIDDARPGLSKHRDWRFSLRWARDRLRAGIMTGDAYASFVLTRVTTQVSVLRHPLLFLALLADACRHGTVTRFDLVTYCGAACSPRSLRRRARALLDARRQPQRCGAAMARDAAPTA
ncbi:MAG: glycosyltransferase family 2 protein [Planctomycetes bacterium]|nr:glycosyltransferase family 2 protein [Planctomycetota bacterium]